VPGRNCAEVSDVRGAFATPGDAAVVSPVRETGWGKLANST
jgi:hypothetical protein